MSTNLFFSKPREEGNKVGWSKVIHFGGREKVRNDRDFIKGFGSCKRED